MVGFFDAVDHADAEMFKKTADSMDDVPFGIALKDVRSHARSVMWQRSDTCNAKFFA